MYNHNKIRYVFISYEDLKDIKFKKLQKVCDRIYILINEGIENLPFKLVQRLQKLGKNVKWIQISEKEEALSLSMAFLLGQMHSKINKEVEFAILSNDRQYDSIISYLNNIGRECIRVKNKKKNIADFTSGESFSIEKEEGEEQGEEDTFEIDLQDSLNVQGPRPNFNMGSTALDMLTNGKETAKGVKVAANETIKRLIRSGNRPSELSLLKSYISLHNQNEAVDENIDHYSKFLLILIVNTI